MARREGSITKDGVGRYRVEIELDELTTAGRKKRVGKRIKGSRRDAEAILRKLIERKSSIIQDKQTLTSLITDYLENIAPLNCRERTIQGDKDKLETHIAPKIGHITLDSLKPAHIQSFYTKLLKSGRKDGKGGLSATSVGHIHALLRKVIRHAHDNEKIAINVMNKVSPPKKERKEISYLSDREVLDLQIERYGTRYNPFIVLATSTGMRLSEVLGLQWRDIDLNGKTATIRRSSVMLRGGVQKYEDPKSESSKRTIPLADITVKMLSELRDVHIYSLRGSFTDETPVIANLDGTPVRNDGITKGVKKLLSKIGRTDVSVHGLRHTVATIMMENSVPMKTVSDFLGHSDFEITANIYSHTSEDAKIDAVNKLVDSIQNQEVSPTFHRQRLNSSGKAISI